MDSCRLAFLVISLAVLTSTLANHLRYSHKQLLHEHLEKDIENEVLDDEDKRMVLLHNIRVQEACKCELPKMQVIHVRDHYPGRYYNPQSTILHRCGKHSGCCASDMLKCVAAKKEKVTLYFSSMNHNDVKNRVAKLVFHNHTKCGCVADGHFFKHDLRN